MKTYRRKQPCVYRDGIFCDAEQAARKCNPKCRYYISEEDLENPIKKPRANIKNIKYKPIEDWDGRSAFYYD